MVWMYFRTETYHPLTVHFPITLLLIASLLSWLSLFKPNADTLRSVLGWTLLTGVPLTWLAIYTGDLADGIVSRHLCDPTILKEHENLAYYLAYTYSFMLLAHGFFRFRGKYFYPFWQRALMAAFALAGAVMLVYASHLGASLVYDQAAGVHIPSGDCAEFE